MNSSNFNKEKKFNDSKVDVKLILETPTSKEIRILMKEGQVMQEHKTAYPIVVHLISGHIDFEVNKQNHELKIGAILSLDGNVPHSLVAKADSVVRLSIAKTDTVNRVVGVANM